MMLPTLETGVADHETRISMLEAVNAQINERLNSMDDNIRWVVGLLITLVIANAGTAITIFLKLNVE